jgi:arginine deiminase
VIAKKYFFLTALPRSGNTLLSVLINQHKKIKVSANSLIPEIFNSLFLLKRDEKFINFPDHQSLDNVVKSVFDAYYSKWDCDYIIDRSSWGQKFNLDIINTLYKKNKFIILKRPMKEIINSFLKLLKENDRNKYLNFLFSKKSILSNNIESVKNILNSKEEKIIIDYKDLIKDHKKIINDIFNFLDIKEKHLNKYNLNQYNVNGVFYNDEYNIKNMHKIKEDEIAITKKEQLLSKETLLKCKELDNYIWK